MWALGADTLIGGGGDDYFESQPGGAADMVQGGSGIDTLWLHQALVVEAAHSSLADPAAIAVMTNGSTVTGIGRLIFDGAAGDDDVTGGGAGDTLYGAQGNDTLNGWTGADELTGGDGPDSFVFSALGLVDTITDFAHGVDLVELAASGFAGTALGVLSRNAFVAGTQALAKGDRILYDAATGSIWHDANGRGAAAVLFAQVSLGTVLTFADFDVN